MFGYVITNCKTLSDEERLRFRSMYCGMCRTLKARHGNVGRLTLSYDMTFLAMVLSALYECDETQGEEKCMPHPVRPHAYTVNSMMDYAADMNIALAYHKCIDNWQDDKNPAFAAAAQGLKRAYRRVSAAYPEKCRAIEAWMDAIREIEAGGREEIDPPMNLTGRMLGTLFVYQDDVWSQQLYRMGEGLGRFIYFMDAYDDLEKDVRKKKFNPLKSIMHQENYESLCRDAMTMMLADCADAFECLPVLRDANLIRNILYSGVWARYLYIQEKKAKSKGAK